MNTGDRAGAGMRAVVFRGGNATMSQKPVPKPGAGDALLRVLAAGVCNTDLELLAGYHGFEGVPGHEFVGLVEQCPSRPELVGKRVVAAINVGCGNCPWCGKGDPRHCPGRKALGIKGMDGAFAQYTIIPAENLHIVDDSLESRLAVFAEPLAAALEVSQSVHIRAGQRVAVLGDGKLGLLIALGLRVLNPEAVLVGKHGENLDIAASQGLKTLLIKGDGSDRLPGGFDVVVEATGSRTGLPMALGMVRPRGVIVAKTTTVEPVSMDLARLVVDEVCLKGSRCGDMGLALHYLAKSLVDVRPLIEAVYPFQEFNAALEHARRPGAKKVLLEMAEI